MDKKQSILGLIPLINYAEECGIELKPVFEKHGLYIDQLSGEAVIDQGLELKILEDALPLFNEPILGLKVGAKVTFTSYGTYAMLLMTSPTFLESIKTGMQFQSLSLLYSYMSIHFSRDWIELRYTMPRVSGELRNFVADRDLIGTFLFVHEFFDDPKQYLLGAGVARPRPALNILKEYKTIVGADLEFDQPYNWFRMPRSSMNLSMRHGNQLAHQVYRTQAYELQRRFYTFTDDLIEQTKQILASYERHYPSVPEIAKMFAMSERTYRRKLGEANCSYRQLLDEHLKERCLDMLATKENSVQDIAEYLGYAESASFLRAFRRWTGMTPKQYLKQLV